MKRNMKKGFSMIELLFAMIIMAALAAIAIPSLSSGTGSAKMSSMKSDARNAVPNAAMVISGANGSEPVDSAFPKEFTEGQEEFYGVTFSVSKDNKLTFDLNGNCTNGFTLSVDDVSDPQITDKTVVYDSCSDGSIDVQ